MDGDLKGLQRMKNWERQGNAMTADERWAENPPEVARAYAL
jgi:hypothetical protein